MSSRKEQSPSSLSKRPSRKILVKPRSNYIETDSGNRISRQSRIKGSQFITLGGKNLVEKGVTIRGDLYRPDLKVPIVSVGRYCILDENCTIRPPSRQPPPLPTVPLAGTGIEADADVNDNTIEEGTENEDKEKNNNAEAKQLQAEKDERAKLKQQQDDQISPETGRIHFPIKLGSCVYIGQGTVVESASIGSCVYIGKNCHIGEFSVIKDCVLIEDGTVIPPYVSVSPFSRMSGKPSQFIEELPESTEQVLEMYCRKLYAGIDVGGTPL